MRASFIVIIALTMMTIKFAGAREIVGVDPTVTTGKNVIGSAQNISTKAVCIALELEKKNNSPGEKCEASSLIVDDVKKLSSGNRKKLEEGAPVAWKTCKIDNDCKGHALLQGRTGHCIGGWCMIIGM